MTKAEILINLQKSKIDRVYESFKTFLEVELRLLLQFFIISFAFGTICGWRAVDKMLLDFLIPLVLLYSFGVIIIIVQLRRVKLSIGDAWDWHSIVINGLMKELENYKTSKKTEKEKMVELMKAFEEQDKEIARLLKHPRLIVYYRILNQLGKNKLLI